MIFFVEHGFRCIAYDRRGFGMSSRSSYGYDYDTLADDLNEILVQLDLHQVTLIGFSMGGGEIARYFTRYDRTRIHKAVLISSVTPFMIKAPHNPEGLDPKIFKDMLEAVTIDRPAFLESFFHDAFGVNLVNKPVSKAMLEYQRSIALAASPIATKQSIKAFSETDFRDDLVNINVATLIVHGDADKIVPEDISANITSTLINDCQFILYPGAPHGLFLTHRERLNNDLLQFFKDSL